MIRKTIFITIGMLLAYTALIKVIDSGLYVSQHQWQDNAITAQRFMYDGDSTITNVIVGSSLSTRLVTDSLPGYYNLSFGGLSIFNGLKILSKQQKLPKRVLIEMNMVLRGEDKDFTANIYHPLWFGLRKNVRAMRDGKQPVGMIVQGAAYLAGKKETPKNSSTSIAGDKLLFEKILNNQVINYTKMTGADTVTAVFNELAQYVTLLQQKGVEIIFFEMPLNARLCTLPLSMLIRNNFYSRFPPAQYRYIPQPDCNDYQTTDGIHLGYNEAVKYTAYLRNSVSAL